MKNWNDEVNKRMANAEQEASRYAFTYDHFGKKGQWLHYFFKKLIIRSIHFWHELIRGKYDKKAYTFQDPRLFMIQQFTAKYCRENMEERKQKIINEVVEIALFILKEDIFYRVRAIDALKLWHQQYPLMMWKDEPLFGLDEPETENLTIWKGK